MTGDLVERLRAKIAEVEEIAQHAEGACVHIDSCDGLVAFYNGDFDGPAHVLRTIQAHRQILDDFANLLARRDNTADDMATAAAYASCAQGFKIALDRLASIYFPEGTPDA